MIKTVSLILTMSLFVIISCSSSDQETAQSEESPIQTAVTGNPDISYNLGLLLGMQAKRQYDEINFDELKKGFQKAFEGNIEEEDFTQANYVLHSYQHIQQGKRAQLALEKGNAFREENAKREGVTVTTNGLQYEILNPGNGGAHPTLEDNITIHYRGTLVDGTEFDNSYTRGKPTTFLLKNLIKGWQEGIPLMQEGSKYKFVIPPQLGYGGNSSNRIPANSTLIFEVELIKVGQPETPEPSKEE